MRNFKYIFFIIIFLLIFIVLNYYIGKRIFSTISNLHKINKKIFWILFWFIAFSYIVYALLNKYFPKYLSSPIMYIGIHYMAISIYLLILFFITDIFLIINKKFNFFPNIKDKSLLFSLIFCILIIALVAIGSFNANNSYVKNYDIKIDKDFKEEKLNIVLISDIHLGDIIGNSRLQNMVSEINNLNPDIVLISGDLIDSSIKPFIENNMASQLGKIKSKYGTFFSLGNHDIFDNKIEQLSSLLTNEGINVLRDNYKLINNSFYIVGRDDVSISRIKEKRKYIKDIINDIDNSKPIILIDHNPSSINESLESNIDLQVSGHTHKGQLIPFNLITKCIFENHYGYMRKNNFNIVVSSGYGTWGPPLRIGSRSEIVNITLQKIHNVNP
ncbi:metallophosphoesterase [Clostridium sp. CTA-5]